MLSVAVTTIRIPTYVRGGDDPYPPLTFSGRRRGRARPFPYHMQDDIDIATMRFDPERMYRAVILNNGLLEVIVLPDMNGRVYSVRDVRSGRELFYRNNVVKPALVALRGAWISGGIEFNFPTRGHTVSTVSPVFFRTEECADSVSVTVGDIDLATRLRWQARISLRRGRAAVDVALTFANPNLVRERLYHWQNAAVPAVDDMRFVCRCDWTVGSESLPFPIRDGVDASMHVSNARPLDHFGYRSYRDFFGAYYLTSRQGTYHVAPRWLEPGQKYFTWGTQEDNRIWESFLTDEDGQYVEIQAGLLESQFVTGWIGPQEVVRTGGSWFGTEGMPELTWANERVAAALAGDGDGGRIDVYSIDVSGPVTVTLTTAAGTLEQTAGLRPGEATSIALQELAPCQVALHSAAGTLLLAEEWSGGDDLRALDPGRPSDPPVQWAMQARGKPGLRKVEEHLKTYAWEAARDALTGEGAALIPHARNLLLAELALKTGAFEQAYESAVQAALADPGDAGSHSLALASALRLLRVSGDPHWYYAVWDHAMVARRDGRFRCASLFALAEAEILRGKLLSAVPLLEELVDARPELIDPRVLLCGVRRRCGMPGADGRQRTDFTTKDTKSTKVDGTTENTESTETGKAGEFAERGLVERRFLERDTRRLASPISEFADAELFPHAWCEMVLVQTDQGGLPPLPTPRTDSPESTAHRDAVLLEVLLLYWRVGWLDDVACLLGCLQEREGVGTDQPLWDALQSDVLAETGDASAGTAAAMRAAEGRVDWVLPCRWEEAELLRRVEGRLRGENPNAISFFLTPCWLKSRRVAPPPTLCPPVEWEGLPCRDRLPEEVDSIGDSRGSVAYLMGVWQAEHGDVEGAVTRFKTCIESPCQDVRALSAKALADWAEGVAGDLPAAAGFLRTLLAVRPADRRALIQLDDCLRATHDVTERCTLWESVPAGLRERGDVTFRVARCAFDAGRAEEAVQFLLGTHFSVYEGGTSVRRLYVDALLVAAMVHWRDGNGALAGRRCRDVFEYPENLGAASYLGEHSRLARFLLGVFAEKAGRNDEARTWWEDVLTRSGGEKTYVVGGEDAAAGLRADERLAVMLSAVALGRSCRAVSVSSRSLDSEGSATDAVYRALAVGATDATGITLDALARYPCNAVLRILAGVGELVCS